jgi:hypothetical protein
MHTSNQFYEDMPAIRDLARVMDIESYAEMPADWLVVVSDVEASTQALEEGNYKGVNFVASSILMAVLNIVKPLHLPFMFGGDGSSICIPTEFKNASYQAIKFLQKTAADEFGLNLRVAIIPYAKVKKGGYEILVAKYQVSANYYQAFFKGEGLSFAEKLLKNADLSDFENQMGLSDDDINLDGLECRWNSVPSPHGETIALLVKVIGDNQKERSALYNQVLEKIHEIYGEKEHHHPLSLAGLNLSYNLKNLRFETRLKTSGKSFFTSIKFYIKILFENALGKYLMSHESTLADVNWGQYKNDLLDNAHFLGFNDMINMVLSGTENQRLALVEYLDRLKSTNKLFYGVHVSQAALVTCLIFEREKHHIHFVDADLGGYANACKQLKKQVVESSVDL